MDYSFTDKTINPRLCIEKTILHFNPDISDKDLLDLREQIYYNVWEKTHSPYGFSTYDRDYYLYSRKKGV